MRRGFRRLGLGLVHEWALAAYASCLLAVAMTWPALRYPMHTLPQDLGDPARQAWQVAWAGHILSSNPVRLWQSNAYFPEPFSFAFGDTLIGYAFAGMIGTGPSAAILRYNVLFVLAHALLVFGAYVLVRQLGARKTGAAVAAVAFAYAPWRLAQEGHLDIISAGGIPLALAMLARAHGYSLRHGLRPERRHAGWAAGGWLVATWQLMLGFSLAIPFAYVLGLLLVVITIAGLYRHLRRVLFQRPPKPAVGSAAVPRDVGAGSSASGSPVSGAGPTASQPGSGGGPAPATTSPATGTGAGAGVAPPAGPGSTAVKGLTATAAEPGLALASRSVAGPTSEAEKANRIEAAGTPVKGTTDILESPRREPKGRRRWLLFGPRRPVAPTPVAPPGPIAANPATSTSVSSGAAAAGATTPPSSPATKDGRTPSATAAKGGRPPRRRPGPPPRQKAPTVAWWLVVVNALGAQTFIAVASVIALPYVRALNPGSRIEEITFFSPPLRSLLIGPAESRVWGAAHATPRESLGWAAEMSLLPGFTLYALALAGLFLSVWPFRHRLLLVAGLTIAVILTLGTNFFGGEWTYLPLFGHFPAAFDQRVPGRLMLWVTLLLAILAAGAVDGFVRRTENFAAQRIPPWPGPWLRLATLTPLLLVALEGWNATAHPVVPAQPASMRTVPGPLLVLPTAELSDQTVQLWTTTRFQQVANGGGTFAAQQQNELRARVANFPDAASSDYLISMGITKVLLLRDLAEGTRWEEAADRPVDSLGIRREDLPDAVVFYLN
ncbi:hypothetical protein [Actinoplanes sp. G11-F43]|uniref:hypothetical protein n=1 Tax=Actinoplanes sp. G11-F43 TaxID=3424130 RepID=UPI003D349A3A